jgi:uncharacterized protein YkwD
VSTCRPSRIVAAALTAAALICATPTPAQAADAPACAGAQLVPALGLSDQLGQATLCLIDARRAAAGVPALSDSPLLDQVASRYAAQMVAEGFFDHVSPAGSTLAARIGAAGDFAAAGEDLGYADGLDVTPAAMVGAWMGSAPHRANILDPSFTQLGVGVAVGTPGGAAGATYVADFATPDAGSAPPAKASSTRHARRCTRARARRHLWRLIRHRL